MTDEMWAQLLARLKKGYDISNLLSIDETKRSECQTQHIQNVV